MAASKASFTPEEWDRILRGAMLAGMAVTAAEPSGVWGLIKESLAAGGALAEARADTDANELVRAVAADLATAEGRTAAREGLQADLAGGEAAGIKPKAITELRQVAALLDAKAPEDAPAFKAWLLRIAERVAEASKEGGFLGFGGVQVSEAERATLAEISDALNLAA
jgi:hypothetical protein